MESAGIQRCDAPGHEYWDTPEMQDANRREYAAFDAMMAIRARTMDGIAALAHRDRIHHILKTNNRDICRTTADVNDGNASFQVFLSHNCRRRSQWLQY